MRFDALVRRGARERKLDRSDQLNEAAAVDQDRQVGALQPLRRPLAGEEAAGGSDRLSGRELRPGGVLADDRGRGGGEQVDPQETRPPPLL